jgi:hypothetical protein
MFLAAVVTAALTLSPAFRFISNQNGVIFTAQPIR